jgi:hypothetical protein
MAEINIPNYPKKHQAPTFREVPNANFQTEKGSTGCKLKNWMLDFEASLEL